MGEDWTRGLELYRAERHEEAIPHLERAARTPDDEGGGAIRGPALNHLGMAQYVLGRYDDAVATFRAAILQMPGKARLHYNLGNSLLAVGRLPDAKRQYELALDLEPDYDEAKEALVVIAAEMVGAPPPPTPPEPQQVPAPPASKGDAPQADRDGSRRRVEELEAQLREARQAVQETRFVLERQEQALNDVVEELLAAVRAYAVQQEAAVRDAALQQAQALLAEAASRHT